MVLKNAKAIELINNNAFFVKKLLLVDDLTSLGTPVSYTHLDVYKRQEHRGLSVMPGPFASAEAAGKQLW